jgi:hypothetical protein
MMKRSLKMSEENKHKDEFHEDQDVIEACKHYYYKSGVFEFPCMGRTHSLRLDDVTYIGPIRTIGREPFRRNSSGYGERTYFQVGIKHTGILDIDVKPADEYGEVSDWIYSLHRGLIKIWKKKHESKC